MNSEGLLSKFHINFFKRISLKIADDDVKENEIPTAN